MANWNIDQSQIGDTLSLKFSGWLDESINYPDLDFQSVKNLEVDFSKVELINSTGIQKWVVFFSKIPDSIAISFVYVPSLILEQISMISDFLGGKKVDIKTFNLPYYCESCDCQYSIMFEKSGLVKNNKGKNVPPPHLSCNVCSSMMEYDNLDDLIEVVGL